uniref:Uncharacterized protein n=1 Tax=Panagrolaimus sp. PS1159 TaxID=55785 RepID=A0AC35FBW7_9BILA
MNNLDVLSSDGENAIKFVRNGEEAELELENKELMFKFCSVGCMGKKVVACFDSTDSNSLRQGDCDPGQCEFKAGVAETDETFLWFKTDFYRKLFSKDSNICETAIMKWPDAIVSFSPEFPSCNPLKHDGNVIKLYILQAKRECPLYVLNAKKWTPPSPTTTTQNSSNLSETKET